MGQTDLASNLSKTNHRKALEAAAAISDPYSRCQALAWVARYAPDDETAVRLAKESTRAAESASEPYQSAAAAAWPVRALLERGRQREAEAILRQAVARSKRIANPASRADALFLLVQAGWHSKGKSWPEALSALLAAATTAPHQKPSALLRDLALMLAGGGRDHAAALAAISDDKYRRQAERRLQERRLLSPRPFFW